MSLALVGAFACGGVTRVKADAHGGTGGDNTGASGALDAGDDAAGSRSSTMMGSGGYPTAGSGGSSAVGSGGYSETGGAWVFGGTTGAGGRDASACFAISQGGEPVTPDILILLDRSLSMSCVVPGGGDRWAAVKAGLTSFLMQAPAGRSVGIQYFESEASADAGASCNPSDYQAPDVELAPLPRNAQLITGSLDRHGPGGRTPTPAALVGALNHLIDWKKTHAAIAPAVVLVTDGAPDFCGSAADVADAAALGAENGITTFVIGLADSANACSQDPNPTNQKDLDAIAQSGGSRNAFMVDLQGGIELGLVNALNEAQLTTALTCRFQLPRPMPGMAYDATTINVGYVSSGSTDRTSLLAVAGKAACDPKQGGWYFDDASTPTEIDLCPQSCSTIDSARGSVNIYFGCPTEVP